MSYYIATIKFKKGRVPHNPQAKITAVCPFHLGYSRSPNQQSTCTDSTGEHHSGIRVGNSADEITRDLQELGYHVTRVEGPVVL